MKLAVYTVCLPEYTIEEAPALLKSMGCDAVEWRVDDTSGGIAAAYFANLPEEKKFEYRYWTDNKATLDTKNIMEDCLRAKKVCDEAGIEIVNLAAALGNDLEQLEKVLAAAKAIGCRSIRGPMVGYNPKKSYKEQLDTFRANLKSYEPLLKKYGVKMMIETHHGNLVTSASAAMLVLNGFDPDYYGLIYDPGNMVFEGFENYKMGFDMLGKYLAHVHIKNGAYTPAGEDEFGATKYAQSWKPLDKGSANLYALIKALVEVGYDGVLSIEDFSNEKPTYEKLQEGLDYLKKLIAAAEKAN